MDDNEAASFRTSSLSPNLRGRPPMPGRRGAPLLTDRHTYPGKQPSLCSQPLFLVKRVHLPSCPESPQPPGVRSQLLICSGSLLTLSFQNEGAVNIY